MQPTSANFGRLMRTSHVIVASCGLIWPGETDEISVPVEAGEVRIDRTAQNRRAGNVQIPWSLQAGADLGVDVRTLSLGGYAVLRRGVRYADGSTETVLLGRLRVESVSWETLETSANLELADRMSQVRDEPFTAPFAAGGMTAATASRAIVQQVFGSSIAYDLRYTPTDVITDAFYSGERSEALSTLAQSVSAESYFDANGDYVFARKPADSDPVVWTVDCGAQGVLVDARENLDRTGIYNGVLVSGQPSGDSPPISALAIYDDPTSPIRWGGPFGKVALISQSTTVQTPEQAAATARDLLRLRLKQTRNLELITAPNPALEAGDTIEVIFPDGRDERHLIDAVTVNLGTDAQALVTRTQATPTVSAGLRFGAEAWQEVMA